MKRLARTPEATRYLAFLGLVGLAVPLGTADASPADKEPGRSAALSYLEKVEGKSKDYVAPSQLDERFTIALYVNAKGRGANAQRMWVLQRDAKDGEFRLAMWDKKWWRSKAAKRKYKLAPGEEPPFSWLVSTGYKWPGDPKSGPTSLGVFAIDERKGRTQRGWHTHGMIHVFYIDYHYRSGRRSGIAFHGTTRGQYRKLGRIASHGCIRMHQSNALSVLKRIKGWDNVLAKERRWGEVPRFWRRERYSKRYGYVRNGSLLRQAINEPVKVAAAGRAGPSSDLYGADIIAMSRVLTKTGYRAVAVIFKD